MKYSGIGIYIFKKGLFKRQSKKEIFHLLPKGSFCKSQDWAWLKSGSWNSLQVSHMGGWHLNTWATTRCLLGNTYRMLDPKQSCQDLEWHCVRDASITRGGLYLPLCHNGGALFLGLLKTSDVSAE